MQILSLPHEGGEVVSGGPENLLNRCIYKLQTQLHQWVVGLMAIWVTRTHKLQILNPRLIMAGWVDLAMWTITLFELQITFLNDILWYHLYDWHLDMTHYNLFKGNVSSSLFYYNYLPIVFLFPSPSFWLNLNFKAAQYSGSNCLKRTCEKFVCLFADSFIIEM